MLLTIQSSEDIIIIDFNELRNAIEKQMDLSQGGKET
jgi:hypothetical protein